MMMLSILTLTIRNKVLNRVIGLVLRLMNRRVRVSKLALDIVVGLTGLVQAERMVGLRLVQV